MKSNLRLLWVPFGVTLAWVANLGIDGTAKPERVSMLAVGQGHATLIQSQGVTVLVDTGPPPFDEALSPRALSQELRQKGVTVIDLIVITHPDADHAGALNALARDYPVREIWANEAFRMHPDTGDWGKVAPVRWLTGQSQVKWGAWAVDLYAPPWEGSDNERSVAVRGELDEVSFLITGDLPAGSELRLPPAFLEPTSVVMAGHHGANSSLHENFLRRTQPEWVVFSAGRGNSYGHPAPGALERAEAIGARIWRTDRDGTFTDSP